MSEQPVHSTNPSIRALSRGLAQARDGQVTEAVALLDALTQRGDADALIEPLRKRIAGLHPRRPLTFCRLLFNPLDPVIVAAPRWRPAAATIPRTALAPLAETVRAAMGADARTIDGLIRGRSIQDAAVVSEVGLALWPQAGRILSGVPPSVGWAHTGLNVTCYPPLARRIGAVLEQCEALEALVTDTAQGRATPDPDRVAAILDAVQAREPGAQPMMTALLLARLPQAARRLAGAAGRGAYTARGRADADDQAIEVLLTRLETPNALEAQLGHGDLTQSADAVRRIVQLLRESGTADAHILPGRLQALRRRLDETCRERFAAAMAKEVTGPLHAPLADEAEVAQLETAARGLRAFETEARGLTGGSVYDALLRQAAALVRGLPADSLLDRVDRIRLVEILAGPDAALAMLRPDRSAT